MRWLFLLALACTLACAAARGKTTTLLGTARNAKGGAVVVRDDGGAVYVGGLEAWPAALDGQRVEVTGQLVRKKLIPDPVVGPNGERSAGAEGDQTVIEKATWRAAR